MGSGAILTEVLAAARELAEQGVGTDVLSVTSWSELARDGLQCEQRQHAALARASEVRRPVGTAQFHRPEQLQGCDVVGRGVSVLHRATRSRPAGPSGKMPTGPLTVR